MVKALESVAKGSPPLEQGVGGTCEIHFSVDKRHRYTRARGLNWLNDGVNQWTLAVTQRTRND